VTAWRHYLRFGGMPALSEPAVADEEREQWLLDYRRTYLERDVRDLAALRDLEPFVRAQALAAARTGGLLNVSDLARGAGVAVNTAARFLRYLELSYQVLLLPPWFRNRDKRLAKMPKLHFVDPGVQRACLRRRGEPTGAEYESAVVAEVHKQVRNAGLEVDLYHLRTHDGREVDLLLELPQGFVAIEVKQTEHVAASDARGLRGLAELLDKPVLAGLVLSQDREVRLLEPGVLAVPVAWALGPG
jgi:predicted AAA+ superfamily ATPase